MTSKEKQKNTLEIAQQLEEAADRTIEKATKAAQLVDGKLLPWQLADESPFNDPSFKGIGSRKKIVNYAQAVTWTAQLFLNSEIAKKSKERDEIYPVDVQESRHSEQEYIGGFQSAAKELYEVTSEMLREAGYHEEADRVAAKAAAIEIPEGDTFSPKDTLWELHNRIANGIPVDTTIIAERSNDKYVGILERLKGHTDPPDSLGARRQMRCMLRFRNAPGM